MESEILIGVVAALAVVFILSLARNKGEIAVNFLLRSFFTILAIYIINKVLGMQGIISGVQINEYTVPIGGILGIPGLFLMYGLFIYFSVT